MRQKEYSAELGVTAACTVRMARQVCRPGDTLLGDSWFSSVKAAISCAKQGVHYIGVVKTSHSSFPLSYLHDMMKDMPGGLWMVLRSNPAHTEGFPLVAAGYKYNSKTPIFFIMTEGAETTMKGKSYLASYADSYGNLCTRAVPRPAFASKYFEHSPKVRFTDPRAAGYFFFLFFFFDIVQVRSY